MSKIRICDIAEQVRGVSYKPCDIHSELSENSVILLRANNISDGKINFDDVVYVDKSRVSQKQILRRGDILVCASSGSKDLVGKAASIDFDKECTFGAFCKVVRPNAKFVNYLGVYFQSNAYRRKIFDVAIGANINNIKNEHIDLLEIPTYDEIYTEEFIAQIINIQNVINCRKKQLAKLDELVKARFVEMFGDPKYNKSNLIKIGEIGALTSGGTPSRAKPEYFEGDIRWYSAGELNSLYLPDSVEHISEMALQQSAAKLFCKGTLLIGMYDTAAFKMGILTEDSSSNQACANLNPKQEYNIVWLYYLFDIMKPIFLQERQGVRQKNLSLSKIKEFEVPFAPFELQNHFADFVKQVDKSKVAVQKALDEAQTLFDSLMQQYFG